MNGRGTYWPIRYAAPTRIRRRPRIRLPPARLSIACTVSRCGDSDTQRCEQSKAVRRSARLFTSSVEVGEPSVCDTPIASDLHLGTGRLHGADSTVKDL